MKLKTVYINPPIPFRSLDWCAYDSDGDESGPRGWGTTEQEAIQELRDQTLFDVKCARCGRVFPEHTQTSGYSCPNKQGTWTP